MRRLILAISLSSLAATPHFNAAASRRSRECPSVTVSCDEVVRSGEPMTFTATIVGAQADAKPAYNWAVSAGTIQD